MSAVNVFFVDSIEYSQDGLTELVYAKRTSDKRIKCKCINRKKLVEENDLVFVIPKYAFIPQQLSSKLSIMPGVVKKNVCFNVDELLPNFTLKLFGETIHVIDNLDFDYSDYFGIVHP